MAVAETSAVAPPVTTATQQKRSLSHFQAGAVVAGSMVGIGIFLNPHEVAGFVHGSGSYLMMWLFGGLAALCGALCSAELGTLMPHAGGEVVYLREAYGPTIAFADGWIAVLAVMTGSIATLAVAAAHYQIPTLLGRNPFVNPFSATVESLIAIAIVVVLTGVNHLGARVSGRMQLIVSAVPMGLLLIGAVYGLGDGGASRLGSQLTAPGAWAMPSLSGFALAYLAVYWTYSGWNAATYVAGEVEHPDKGLPRALILGTAAVVVLYLLLNVGYLAVIGGKNLPTAFEAGTSTATSLFGGAAGRWMAALIGVKLLTTINGTVLGGSRIVYAMAEQGSFPRPGKHLDKRFATPTVALWFQAGWTILLILSAPLVRKLGYAGKISSFDLLLEYTTTAMLITGSLAVGAVMVLRRRHQGVARPYSTWGYPVTPLIYLVSSLVVLGTLLYQGKASSYGGVLILVAGFIAGTLWTRAKRA